jgi:hypothetical protein
MSAAKTHYCPIPQWQGDTACGRWVRSVELTTSQPGEVTCKRCLAQLPMLTEVTIGWTKHREGPLAELGYVPFSDQWRPGQPQHEITLWVDTYGIKPEQVAEVVFTATNHPDPGQLVGPALLVHHGIVATGYRGEEAHWSLSVGDTVTVDGTVWACAPFGWTEVSA